MMLRIVLLLLIVLQSSFALAITEDLVKVFALVVHRAKIDLQNGENIDLVLDNCGKYLQGQNNYGLAVGVVRLPSTNTISVVTIAEHYTYYCVADITLESTSDINCKQFKVACCKANKDSTATPSKLQFSTYIIDISNIESLKSLKSLRTANYIENNEHPSFTAAPDSSSSSSPLSDSSVADFPVISSEETMEDGIRWFKSIMINFRITCIEDKNISEEECMVKAWGLVEKKDAKSLVELRGARDETGFLITLKIFRFNESNLYFRAYTKYLMDENNPRYTIYSQIGIGRDAIKHPKLKISIE